MTTLSGSIRWGIFILAIGFSSMSHAQQPATNAPSTSASTPTTSAPAVDPNVAAAAKLAREALQLPSTDLDGAVNKASAAIKLDPKNPALYVLRASFYTKKNIWPEAIQDFETAQQLAPANVTIKFNLVEIKFLQKQYDDARAGFVALESDPDLGDLCSYKVFLCDLFGGHEDLAKSELDAFNKVGSNASYYYANAAWDLVHKKTEDARSWLISAYNIYSAQKNDNYGSSLRDLGYLPLPPAPAKQ